MGEKASFVLKGLIPTKVILKLMTMVVVRDVKQGSMHRASQRQSIPTSLGFKRVLGKPNHQQIAGLYSSNGIVKRPI
jgi:hypothetical protein